jgi:hypothetical protein
MTNVSRHAEAPAARTVQALRHGREQAAEFGVCRLAAGRYPGDDRKSDLGAYLKEINATGGQAEISGRRVFVTRRAMMDDAAR